MVLGENFLMMRGTIGLEASPRWHHIALERRDVGGNFDNLVGEFRSKGGRMRFIPTGLPINSSR